MQFYLSKLVLGPSTASSSSTFSPAAPLPGRFSLLARYLFPEKCYECANDVENVCISHSTSKQSIHWDNCSGSCLLLSKYSEPCGPWVYRSLGLCFQVRRHFHTADYNPEHGRSCRQCLCEVVAAQLTPELSVQLCEYCPELEVCPDTTIPSAYIEYFEGKNKGNKWKLWINKFVPL